ncbi:MAG: hypothetical protein QHC40_02850 [Sphingobium sp.]|nr:hypothetical protein [Sphingobium sp.]
MADTPEVPAKRGRSPKADAPKATRAKPVKGAVVSTPAASPPSPVQTDTNGGNAATGWSAQVAPLKAKAGKAAQTAADKLNEVDWKAHLDPLKEQAGKTAKSAADVAKGKTGTAMQSLAKLISDTAGTVDAKLGPQYGDYARQAAQSVAGAADSLDSKDVDQLLTEARDFVRRSPAVAIGAAAVVGFVLMRLAKGSSEE